MPSFTDNHAFQLFADTEEPWEHRSDFQKLDTRTPIVDTDANKTNYTAKTDALYLAYDTEILYRGNGSSWVSLADLSQIGSGGGTGDVSNANIAPASVVQYDTQAPIQGATVEGFDAGDLSHYAGDTAPYSVVASDIEGSNMLRFDSPTGTTTGTAFHMPSGVTTTQRGMSYSAYVRGSDGGTATLAQYGFGILTSYSAGSITDGFVVRINIASNQLEVLEYAAGFVGGTTRTVTLSNDTLYRLEIDAEAGSDDVTARLFDANDLLLATLLVTPTSSAGNESGGFAWYARTDAEASWAEYDLLNQQPLNSAPNRLAVASPDITRLFVRDTDPALEYDVHDGSDFWIDTSSP